MSDSFWEGSGSAVGDIESVVMARALGMNAVVAAVGSTGIINPGGNNTSGFPKVEWTNAERIKDLTLSGVTSAQDGSAVRPSIGAIGMSVNDPGASWATFGATVTDALQNRLDLLIDAWLADNPGAPLFVFGPTWPSGAPNNRPVLDVYRMRDAGMRACMGRPGKDVWFIDRLMPPLREGLWSTVTDQASLYTSSDQTHPSPDGHRFDGLWMAAQVRQILIGEFFTSPIVL
jgi:hypothetical protein